MKKVCGLLFCLFLIGCQQQKELKTDVTPKPTPVQTKTLTITQTAPQLILNISEIVGKTPEEVKKFLGEPLVVDKLNATDKTGELSFDYKKDGAEFFINFKKGKADYFHFDAKKEFETVFELGNLVGIELEGVTPIEANNSQITYSGKIGNTTWYRIRVVMSAKGYKILTLQKTP